MELVQAKPVRRRRHRLMVASALVLVSMASWWCWPTGDARFVGKWKDGDSGQVRSLRSNGYCFENRQGRTLCYPWKIVDGSLELGFDSRTFLGHAALKIQRPSFQRLTGLYPAFGRHRFGIVGVSTKTISLSTDRRNIPHTVHWERVPE